AGRLCRRQQDAGSHRGRALDIVVESAQVVTVTVEQAQRIGLREILELQTHMRPAFYDRGDKLVNEFVVVVTADALVPPADIYRIVETILIIRTGIQQNRQRGERIDAGTGGVQRQLADRDAHAAGALIAQTENALTV